jgi:molecular chaperone GrpE
MDNYRRRQRRIARDEARRELDALLRDVLGVADNLDRALVATRDSCQALTEGVELTRSELQRVLAKYGLQRMQVQGQPFDPKWHEAVHVVPAQRLGVEPGTVVRVLQAGYSRKDSLFRPAKVVVAQ